MTADPPPWQRITTHFPFVGNACDDPDHKHYTRKTEEEEWTEVPCPRTNDA